MRTEAGVVEISDCLALRSGADLTEETAAARGELIRRVRAVEGEVELRVDLEPFGGAAFERADGGYKLSCPRLTELNLRLFTKSPAGGALKLRSGETAWFVLSWMAGSGRRRPTSPGHALDETAAAWRRWMSGFSYDGPRQDLVRRSAITLKLLDCFRTGAIIAAPTSSLPELIGGVRNWDYRYTWVRDAAFAVYALHRIGFPAEASGFLAWVLDAFERSGTPRVLYEVDGADPPDEREDTELEGYRRSRPVRWGNAAAGQVQNDLYGEVLDCAFQWKGHIDDALWARLRGLVEIARREWRKPDRGIWEVRTPGRPFTYSAALCQVAVDRGARVAARLGLDDEAEAWRAEAERMREEILRLAWNPDLGAFGQHLGGGPPDASLLTLPIRRLIRADDPRMVATTEAIRKRLGAGGGLLYRYIPAEAPDGLPGHEGAFVLCSFWLVDNLTEQGRLDEAMELYDSLCGRASEVGLLPEEIDPGSGEFLGNFPQAFSHVGLIASGFRLGRRMRQLSR
jgi:GH15 family glucan-1,4-alpha-glucosidase